MWHIRLAHASDQDFVELALYEAAFWRSGQDRPPLRQAMADPRLGRYVHGWGRSGDSGLIAEQPDAGPVGAAWFRLFDESAPGYGFIDAMTPELSIAVLPSYRRRGIGHRLLTELMELAREAGFHALSLSVACDNPAAALYLRVGFKTVRAVGGSWTMRAELK